MVLFLLFSSCRDRNDLAEVVALLKTQIDPELLKRDQENKPEGEEKTLNLHLGFYVFIIRFKLLLFHD